VNNAGTTEFIPLRDLESVTDAIWDRTFATNVKAIFHVSPVVVPQMRVCAEGMGDRQAQPVVEPRARAPVPAAQP